MLLRSPENFRERSHNYFIDFLIWVTYVDLTIEADEYAYQDAQDYLAASPHGKIIFSAAPHTGHPDSLYVDKAIRTLFPSHAGKLLFASAKDTWDKPWKKLFAKMTIGEMFLFNREPQSSEEADAQNNALVKQMVEDKNSPKFSPVIYPQATRTLGAPIQSLPITIAERAGAPIVTLNITGAENVMPKVVESEEMKQLREMFMRRLRSKMEEKAHVTVTMTNFIRPENKKRGQLKKELLDSHSR